jgi:hypothetical protein
LGYKTNYRLSRIPGVYNDYKHNTNIYTLQIHRKEVVSRLASKILVYSKHSEKTRKINLILNLGNQSNFDNIDEIENNILTLRREIMQEVRNLSK